MLKIGIINSVYKFGSTGRLSFELAKFFLSQGNVCKVFYGRGKKERDGIGIKFSYPFSVKIHAFLARIFDAVGCFSFFSTRRLIKVLEREKINTLIINNLHGYYINLRVILSYAKKKNIKTIFVLHDCWLFTGHCAHFLMSKCDKWKTLCSNCPNKREYPKSILFDNSKRNYLLKKKLFYDFDCTLIAPSKWIYELAKASFLKNKNITHIPNGIDIEQFKRHVVSKEKFGEISNKKIILSVASIWDKKKGLFDLVKLANIIDDDYIIVIVGKLKAKINHDKIYKIEQTKNIDELVDIYSIANVMFNPTYEDNYPTVNLEAISCRCPVVSYNVGGACEMLNSKYFVKSGDYKTAYEIIKKIVEGKEEYLFIDKTELSINKMLNRYLNSVLDNPNKNV